MKKFLVSLIVIILAASAGIIYLNQAILPVKMKAAITAGLEEATQKKVLLGSVRFNIFRGLILKDLIIRDESNAIINVKEAYCGFLIIPLLDKKIIISRLLLESPEIFIERRADNSVNILELFPEEDRAPKSGFKAFVRKVSIRKAAVVFHDLTLEPFYAKEIKDLDADIDLQLPAKIKFRMKFDIPSDLTAKIGLDGEYSIISKELSARIRIKDLAPEELARYYENTGISFSEGVFDSVMSLKYRDGVLSIDSEAQTEGLEFSKGGISAGMTGSGRSSLRYDFAGHRFDYTGNVNLEDMNIDGIEYVGEINNIKGRIEFSSLGLSSDNITALVLGLPVDAGISVSDLNNPVINIDASLNVRLDSFQDILREKFEMSIPADFSGDAKVRLAIAYPLSGTAQPQVKGSIDMLNAAAGINSGKDRLENLTGKFRFVPNQVAWDDIGFNYHDIHYKSSGTLTDFETPGIQLKLSSKDISLDAVFALNDKVFNFSRFSGKYLDSDLSASGVIDASDPAKLKAKMTGRLRVNLGDLKKPLEKFREKFERAKPGGVVRAEFRLEGDLKDLKGCAIDANLSSESLSLYGFKLATSTMNYAQRNGAGDVLFMRSFLYDGSLGATGKIEWASKGVPYLLDINIDGVKIEKFKADTVFKDNDIAGSIRMSARMKGLSGDIGRLSGDGKISVTEGRLWQLNLFRGLGVLLFTKDFSNIIFREGYCNFSVGDRAISTDELTLKSGLVDLYGPMKIGFDNSVSAALKAEFSEDALESGTRKNIKAAIGNYMFIAVAGTLKDPQYKVRPDVESIVDSIAERFNED